MDVVRDRRGKVVAAFTHYSDVLIYLAANQRHAYTHTDEPGIEEVVNEWLSRPSIGHDGTEQTKS